MFKICIYIYFLLMVLSSQIGKAQSKESIDDSSSFINLLNNPASFTDLKATSIYLKAVEKVLFTDMDSAKTMYLEMVEFGKMHQNDLMVARAYYTVGFLAQYAGDFETQKTYLEKSLPYLGNDQSMKSDFYGTLGLVYTRLNQLDLAESYIDSSIQFAENLMDSTLLNTAYMNKAELYNKQSQYNSSIEYALKAQPFVPARNQLRRYGIQKWLGKSYLNIKDYDKSISYSKTALSIAEEYNYKRSKAEVYDPLGKAYLAKEDYQQAKIYFEEAVEYFENKKVDFLLLDGYGNLLYTYSKLGELNKARSILSSAQRLFQKIKIQKEPSSIIGPLAAIMKRLIVIS